MKFGYFPGCSLSSSGYDYHLSLKYVTKALGMDLVEVKDWVCCGLHPPMRLPICYRSPFPLSTFLMRKKTVWIN